MNSQHHKSLIAISSLTLALAWAPSALALANRVFVSARSGNDANACDNINTPCQTFAGAVLKLNPGGEAIVLDSGGYGPVTITQSVTIEAPAGVLAFVHPPSGDAITINAGLSDIVILRGLVLNGGSVRGIRVNTAGRLYVENCVISGFSQEGIYTTADAHLFMKDSISRQNSIGIGIRKNRASIDHCRFEGNVNQGLFVDGADVTVRDSVAAGNGSNGFDAGSLGSSENTVLNVYQSTSANNGGDGFRIQKISSGSVIARLANSSITENKGVGLENAFNSGTFESLGNNLVRGNSLDVSTGITIVPGQ